MVMGTRALDGNHSHRCNCTCLTCTCFAVSHMLQNLASKDLSYSNPPIPRLSYMYRPNYCQSCKGQQARSDIQLYVQFDIHLRPFMAAGCLPESLQGVSNREASGGISAVGPYNWHRFLDKASIPFHTSSRNRACQPFRCVCVSKPDVDANALLWNVNVIGGAAFS